MKKCWSIILTLALLASLIACQPAATWQEQYDLGVRYLSEGNYEEAIIAFTAAIEIDPKRVDTYLGRAEAYIASGETEDNLTYALADYEAVLDMDELNATAWLGLADVYIKLGNEEKAAETLAQGAELTGERELEEKLAALTALTIEDITIITQDHSIRNQSGEVLIELTYDLAQLPEYTPAYQAINQVLQREYHDYVDSHKDAETFLEDPWISVDSPYFNTVTAQGIFISGGILSVAYFTDWYMGGVYNDDYDGHTFDLDTGRLLSLADLFPRNQEGLLQTLKSTIRDYLIMHDILVFDSAYETIAQYTLEGLAFYLQDGEVILCIPEYELAPGSEGSLQIPTGIMVGSSEPTPTPNPAATPTNEIEAGYFIGKTVGDLINYYGSEYESGGFEGSTWLLFPNSAYFLIDYTNHITEDLIIQMVMGSKDGLLADGLIGGMTYSEMVRTLEGKVELDEPAYYYDRRYDEWLYELYFTCGDFSYHYWWDTDPYTSWPWEIRMYRISPTPP